MQEWSWSDFQPHEKLAVRKRIAELVAVHPTKELLHEHIEQTLCEMPKFRDATVEDDWFHVLITEVYAEYLRLGAADF